MKLLVAICLLGMVALSYADTTTHSRGCIYIMGRCYKECPVGTHAYTTGCGPKLPEATCDQPNPVSEKAIICDYSACYCDPPTVRDTKTDTCVQLSECTKKE